MQLAQMAELELSDPNDEKQVDPLRYKKMEKTMKLHVGMSRSTIFNKNDYAIAIDWFERVADDLERRTFVRGDGVTCFVNSTELRHIVSEEGITESKSSAGDSTWKLDRVEEVRGEDYCR